MAKNRIFVVPAEGRQFPKAGAAGAAPRNRMVKPGGEYVPAVSFYLRGVRSGDLESYESREAYLASQAVEEPPAKPSKGKRKTTKKKGA